MFEGYSKDAVELSPCDPPFSFYDLTERLWDGAPEHTAEPLRKFLGLMRIMNATAYAEEILESNDELAQELEGVRLRCGRSTTQTAVRLSFFWKPKRKIDWREPREFPN